MTAPDIFALGGRQDDDAEILALFRKWCSAWRDGCRPGLSDKEVDAATDVARGLAEQIFDAPISGGAGLAIKAFMAAHLRDDFDWGSRDDACALGKFADSCYAQRAIRGEDDQWADEAHLYMTQHAMRGLLASAAQFVPELRPLVARAIESPLTLPVGDADADDRS